MFIPKLVSGIIFCSRQSSGIDAHWPGEPGTGYGASSDFATPVPAIPTASFAVSDSSIDLRCPQCAQGYSDIDQLLEHMHQCFGIDKLTCYICYRRFFGTRDLKDHLSAKHFKIIAYRCLCGKEFKWRRTFIKHRKTCASVVE